MLTVLVPGLPCDMLPQLPVVNTILQGKSHPKYNTIQYFRKGNSFPEYGDAIPSKNYYHYPNSRMSTRSLASIDYPHPTGSHMIITLSITVSR